MTEAVFVIPGEPDAATGDYRYDQHVFEQLPSFGVNPTEVRFPAWSPTSPPIDVSETFNKINQIPASTTLIIDGRSLTMIPPAKLDHLPHRIVALIHHPAVCESGATDSNLEKLRATERTALAKADHVIATSTATASFLLREYGMSTDNVTIAEPGTEPALRATGTGTPLQLLCVGSITPQKGYETLLRALEPLSIFDWRLTIAGALDRDPANVRNIQLLIEQTGIGDRVELPGVVVKATLERLYESTDVFVMPSYFEGSEMILANAMARGLPIICPARGGTMEFVPDSAAIKIIPGKTDDLSRALEQVLTDRKIRTKLADAAWDAGRLLPTWAESARRIAAVILGLKP